MAEIEAMPIEPRTGIRAIAVLPSGRIVWPILGGDGTEEPPAGSDPAGGEGGPDTGAADPDWKAEAEKWKAMARKHESQAKANADAAKRLKEREDAEKSETERAQERIAEAERKAAEAEAKVLRAEVAAAKGLSLAMARRLQGTTREELEADADELLTEFKSRPGGDTLRSRPTEKLRPGAVPNAEPEETDPRKLAEKIRPMYS